MIKRKVIEALKGGKVDVSLGKEIRMRNKVLSLRKVIIWVGSPVGGQLIHQMRKQSGYIKRKGNPN